MLTFAKLIETLKNVLNLPLKIALGIVFGVLTLILTLWAFQTEKQEVNDDFNAGYNSLYDMQVVEHVKIDDIDSFLYEHDGNKTNIQFACADQPAVDRLLPIFGTEYVVESCNVVGVPID